MKSRRAKPVDNWWRRQLSTIISKLNFQNILMTLIVSGFGTWQMLITAKTSDIVQTQERTEIKQDSVAVVDSSWKKRNEGWRKRSDSIATVTILKLDSILVILKSK